MTTNRSYRRAMTHEKAISILVENAGTQFDPDIVETFVNLPREVLILQPSEKASPAPEMELAAAVAE
jgi:HD-GYP domain-containing protein (c-di-GMP phosphodiesterase class II)